MSKRHNSGAAILRPRKIGKATKITKAGPAASLTSISELSDAEFDSLIESSFTEEVREPLIGFTDCGEESDFWLLPE